MRVVRIEGVPVRPAPSSARADPRACLGTLRHRLLRRAERSLPPSVFAGLAATAAFASTLRQVVGGRAGLARLRGLGSAIGPMPGWTSLFRDRCRLTATAFLCRWPERLREPRWARRRRMTNDDALRDAIATGRPVVLLTLHYGGVWAFHHWMRAAGFPAAAISLPRLPDPVRDALDARADEANGLTGVPRTIGVDRDGLRRARDHLSAGGVLAVVFDGGGGGAEQVEIDACGVRARVRLGAFRMAEHAGAIVVPCLLRAGPRMGGEITFWPAVPEELVADRARHAEAAADALRKLLPAALAAPAQFDVRHAPTAL